MLQMKMDTTPFHMAANSHNSINALKILIENGAMINLTDKRGMTALMYASDNDDITEVILFINNGADITIKDKCGMNAFMYASARCNRGIMKVFLDKGENPYEIYLPVYLSYGIWNDECVPFSTDHT